MEQRWSLRKPVTLEVQVSHKCHPMVRGRARNIGLEGLFIETGIVIPPVGSCIEVKFALMSGAVWVQICMPAVVIHRTGDGCGILFQAFNRKAFCLIERLLYADNRWFAGQPQRINRADGVRGPVKTALSPID
jgi:hypothetical protein